MDDQTTPADSPKKRSRLREKSIASRNFDIKSQWNHDLEFRIKPYWKRLFALRFKVLLIALLLSAMLLQRPLVPPASPFDHVFGLNYYMVKLGLFFAMGASYACWRDQIASSCWFGALALVAAWWLPDSSLRNLLWILAMSSFVLGVALELPWLPKLPEKMGDWSYGLYLYAFPVQQLLSYLGVVQWVGFAGYVVLCTIVALGCAGVSWFLVERPALAIETLWRAPSAGDLKAKPGPLIS